MHTNLYWRTSDGLRLDSGPYVHALELATGKRATVLVKPARLFFEQALQAMGVIVITKMVSRYHQKTTGRPFV
jgi:ribonucleotide monophosphatase NagD (HAD superfamily)